MVDKDTFFYIKKTLNCGGEILDLSTPKVMGILNITPDSFYDGGSYSSDKEIIKRVEEMLLEGCSVLDIGACSTRPGAEDVSVEEECSRLVPVVRILKKEFPDLVISADTYRATVAEQAAGAGAAIINDISGGTLDPLMFGTMGRLKIPYVLMHIQGNPKTMQDNPRYENVVIDVLDYFTGKITQLNEMGVSDIIIDPGFGFGKTLEHNYQLLNALRDFRIFGCPVLAGFSRKSMINKVLNTTPSKALNGTTVLNSMALEAGSSILRVHDVKEAAEAITLAEYRKSVSP